MSTAEAIQTPTKAAPVQKLLRRFTVAEYHHLAEIGILKQDERVELVDGAIFSMSPMHSRHASIIARLETSLRQQLSSRFQVRVQLPITLSNESEPEPDIVIVQHRDDFYEQAHPKPTDVAVVIEVSASTLAYDRDTKMPVYARSGIGEFWLVDVDAEIVTVFADPREDNYGTRTVVEAPKPIVSATIDGLTIPLEACFGPKRTDSP